MKKIILSVLFVAFLINACSSGDGDGGSACGDLNSINVVQNGAQLNFTLTGPTAEYYEISYLHAGGESNPNNGQQFVLDQLTDTYATGNIWPNGNGSQTILFYARTVCADGSRGDWVGPKTVTINDYCDSPTDIVYSFDHLQWQYGSSATYWQVQYGPSGFNLGSGTTVNTNDSSLYGIPLSANTTYDFYVRSNCSVTGWSAWSGPYSYYSTMNQNQCLAPTSLTYTVTNINSTYFNIEVHFNGNGEDLFEYALMLGNGVPGAGDVDVLQPGYTPAYVNLSRSATYTFYIRGICDNGNRTAWSVMTVDE